MKSQKHTKTKKEVVTGFPAPSRLMLVSGYVCLDYAKCHANTFHQCVLSIAYFIASHTQAGPICIITTPTKLLSGKYVQTTFILQE